MAFLGNFRYALRTLRQSPGFALTAIAVLALGIGANAAIFSVVYAVILRPLPYPDPSRLVFVWQRFPNMPAPFSERMFVARRNYLEWQRQNKVFQEMGAFNVQGLPEILSDSGAPVSTCFASASMFHILGAQTRFGRLFGAKEEHPGRDRVAVLTDTYFERRFHRDSKALGKTITLDGLAYSVIGVLPQGFYWPDTFFNDSQPDVYVPLSESRQQFTAAARMRPGVSLEQARTEMAGIAERLKKADREFYESGTTSVFPFSVEGTDQSLRRALYVLLAAVGFLLMITCANLANLTLARATQRSRDITVRLALGATRGRIVGQLVSESLLVACAGAACGLLVAYWSIKLMLALKPPDIHRPELIAINLPVLAFAAGTAMLAAILFGLGPALAASRADLSSRLKAGGGWGTSAARLRSRQFLIGSEVALALMMLAGAGLMIRSLQQIESTGIGFDTSRLISLDLNLPEKRYPDATMRSRLIRELLVRERAIPGVMDVAATSALPLHTVGVANFHIPGRPEPERESSPIADIAQVSPAFFQVLGLRLEAGRWFADSDLASSKVRKAIVNRSFAQKYFPGENPLDKRLLTGDQKQTFEIIGVVADYRPMGAENGARPEWFQPGLDFTNATLVVRARGVPQAVTRAMLDTARSVAPDLPADKVKTLDEAAAYWTSQRKFNTLLLVIFAGLALVLAMLGIYGVLANLVASRTREIGIRMAVGATPGAIAGLVLRQGMAPVAIGLALGLGGSLALSRFLGALLFQVHARDPLSLTLAVSAILLISPMALYVPLRRATAVDCTLALREA